MSPKTNRWTVSLVMALVFAGAVLALGWWLGGAAELGRSDLALAVPTAIAPALCVAARRQGWDGTVGSPIAVLSLVLVTSLWLLGTTRAGEWFNAAQIFTLLLGCGLALILSRLVLHSAKNFRRWLRWLGVAALAVAWWFGAHVALAIGYAQPPTLPLPDKGRVVVLSGLPLTGTAGALADVSRGQAEDTLIWQAMRRQLTGLTLVDDLAAGDLRPHDRLLLIHPRALAPAALVEIDRFVRSGGKAVILADALSSWPPPHPLGDPRNPPVTSLLTPLLDHWGIRLDMPALGGGDRFRFRSKGHQLQLHSAGSFGAAPATCIATSARETSPPMALSCGIGRGRAVLIGDADWLFAPLWQAEPAWATHLQPADPIGWLASALQLQPSGSVWRLRPRALPTD